MEHRKFFLCCLALFALSAIFFAMEGFWFGGILGILVCVVFSLCLIIK